MRNPSLTFALACPLLALAACQSRLEPAPSAPQLGTHVAALIDQGCGDPSGVASSAWPVSGRCPTATGRSAVRGSRVGTLRFQVGVGADVRGDVVLGPDDVAYVTNDKGQLWAIDAGGDVAWSTPACRWWEDCDVGGGAAVASDGTVYFGGPNASLVAVHADGQQRWVAQLPGRPKASPVIGPDGTVYASYAGTGLFGSPGGIVAIAPDGSEQWTHEVPCGLFQDCGVETGVAIAEDGTLIFGSKDHSVYALDEGGAPLWSYATGGDVLSRIAVDDHAVYVGSNDNAIHAIDLQDGTRLWRRSTLANVTGGVALGPQGRVYAGSTDFRLFAIDATTGAVEWTFQTLSPVRAAPAVDADGVVYFGSDDNKLYAVAPDGTKLWHFDAYGDIRTSPAIALSGAIYVGSDANKLHAVGFTPEPQLYVDAPALEGHPDIAGGEIAVRDVVEGEQLVIQGRFVQTAPGGSVEVRFDGNPLTVATSPGGGFVAEATLPNDAPTAYVDHEVVIEAVDGNGVRFERTFTVRVVLRQVVPGGLQVRFHPYASESDVRAVLAPLEARVRRIDRETRTYNLELDPEVDTETLATTLSATADVAYAVAQTLSEDDGLCDADPSSDDPGASLPGQYYLSNDGGHASLDRRYGSRCEVGVAGDCNNDMEACFVGVCSYPNAPYEAVLGTSCAASSECTSQLGAGSQCVRFRNCRNEAGDLTSATCTSDLDCQTDLDEPGARCVVAGRCGQAAAADADLGWSDAAAALCGAQTGGEEAVVAFLESNDMAYLLHRDLQARLWTNVVECGAPTCATDADCVAALGAGSECRGGACDGPDGDRLPDCVAGQASPGDGCPGACGDDDGDGLSDFDDPEVIALIDRLEHNCLDDDRDGTRDDGRAAIAVQGVAETNCDCVDDDRDGYVDDGCPAVAAVGAPEADIALEDDDENGYVDDIHGYDFRRATLYGERDGTSHPYTMQRPTATHGSLVASVLAETDNGLDLAGINPMGRVMMVVTHGIYSYREATRYASQHGADIINLSWNTQCTCSAVPCVGAARDNYDTCVRGRNRVFNDSVDTSVTYFTSAGNDRIDLLAKAVPDAQGYCSGDPNPDFDGACEQRFPQGVQTYLDTNGQPYPEGTGPLNMAVIAAVNRADRLSDYFEATRPEEFSGSNYSTSNGSGGSVVDFGAHTDRIDHLNIYDTPSVRWSPGATSFATPVAAAVASALISTYPEEFRHKPIRILDRLRQTLEPCAAPVSGGRGCAGNMTDPGRIDLANALDLTAFPLPTRSPFEDETFRLLSNGRNNTTDVDFLDTDLDGDVDFILETNGGPFVEQPIQFLHRYDPSTGRFFSAGTLARGNFNKADQGDLNGDGCLDLVFGGFLQQDTSAGAAEGDLAGLPNEIYFQRKVGGNCLATFLRATDDADGPNGEPVLPTREDITRSVDLFDVDNDGDLDIFFTNAVLPYPGGNLGDQLMINQLVETGTAYFLDGSDALVGTGTGDPHRAAVRRCDVNADGYGDLVVAYNAVNGGANAIYLNEDDGNGGRQFVESASLVGFDEGTGFSHDVECADFTGDGYPELIFARRNALPNLYLLNNGDGTFTDASSELGGLANTTQEVELCDLDGDGVPEVLFGNGDVIAWEAFQNEALRYVPGSGFVDAAADFGFNFAAITDLTEDVDCGDLNGDGTIDAVLLGNAGEQNFLYIAQ